MSSTFDGIHCQLSRRVTYGLLLIFVWVGPNANWRNDVSWFLDLWHFVGLICVCSTLPYKAARRLTSSSLRLVGGCWSLASISSCLIEYLRLLGCSRVLNSNGRLILSVGSSLWHELSDILSRRNASKQRLGQKLRNLTVSHEWMHQYLV